MTIRTAIVTCAMPRASKAGMILHPGAQQVPSKGDLPKSGLPGP